MRNQYNGQLESGNWKEITRETWSPNDQVNALYLPIAWAALPGAGLILAAGAIGTGLAIVSKEPVAIPLFLAGGIALGAMEFASRIDDALEEARDHLIAREHYDAGGVTAARGEHVQEYAQINVYTLRDEATLERAADGDDRIIESGARIDSYGLPVPISDTVAVHKAVASGGHKWSAASVEEIPGLTQEAARQLMAFLINAGFLRYRDGKKNHPDGAELTPSGRAFFKKITPLGLVESVKTRQPTSTDSVGEGGSPPREEAI